MNARVIPYAVVISLTLIAFIVLKWMIDIVVQTLSFLFIPGIIIACIVLFMWGKNSQTTAPPTAYHGHWPWNEGNRRLDLQQQ